MKDFFGNINREEDVYNLSPISNRNTYVRVLLKKVLICNFLNNFKDQLVQVISLGSGLDTFPFQLFTEFQSLPPIRYVELDLPSSVEKKRFLAQEVFQDDTVFHQREFGTSCCSAWRTDENTLQKSYYHLQSCDLRDLKQVKASLSKTSVDFSKPTIIFAEIVLVYLDPTHSDDVIRFFAEMFQGPSCFLDIDHVITEEEFGAGMMRTFAKLQLPLLGLQKYPSIESQSKRFVDLSWDHCRGYTMYNWLQKQMSKEDIQKLDEIERLDDKKRSKQILSHYGVLCAEKGFTITESFFAHTELE
ncbi:unnamed protein product [Agarophyton chilense]